MRMLKCPQCKQQSAWLVFGKKLFSDGSHAHYKQKKCRCGYEGRQVYRFRYYPTDDCFFCRRQQEKDAEESGVALLQPNPSGEPISPDLDAPENEPEPPDPEPSPLTWTKIDIVTDTHGRVTVIWETNDDNDDGMPDNDTARCVFHPKTVEDAIRQFGKSRVGIGGCEVTVTLDGVKI